MQMGCVTDNGRFVKGVCKYASTLFRLSLSTPLKLGSRRVNCSFPPLADRFGCPPDRQDYYVGKLEVPDAAGATTEMEMTGSDVTSVTRESSEGSLLS